jgi:RimJ/RimL family protein N-acetyltransferase
VGPVVIETDRVRLRQWAEEDSAGFAALARDPEVTRFINGGRPLSDAEVSEFIARMLASQAERGWCRWALEVTENPGCVAGFCGPGCTFAPDVEMGWWLRRDLWAKGLATEAGIAATGYCFGVIGFPRLICCVHSDNAASLAVARKVGFRATSRFDYNGMPLVRHELENPAPDLPHDAAYVLDCVGAPSRASSGEGR